MYWTVQEETAAGLCSSWSTEQPSGMGQSLVKCSPLAWRSQEHIKYLSRSGQHRLSALCDGVCGTFWTRITQAAGTHQISSIHCSLSSDSPADPLSSQPYDLQPHRAAIHPHSFLHRRRWEWCYQELAYGQRMHRRQRDLVQGHAVCVSELNPLNTRPFLRLMSMNIFFPYGLNWSVGSQLWSSFLPFHGMNFELIHWKHMGFS